jgi:hypothetical protein
VAKVSRKLKLPRQRLRLERSPPIEGVRLRQVRFYLPLAVTTWLGPLLLLRASSLPLASWIDTRERGDRW